MSFELGGMSKNLYWLGLYLAWSSKLIEASGGVSVTFAITPANHLIIPPRDIARSDGMVLYATCDEENFDNEIDCFIIKRKVSHASPIEESCHVNLALSEGRRIDKNSLEVHEFDNSSNFLVTWNGWTADLQALTKNVAIFNLSSCATASEQLSFYYLKHALSNKIFIGNLVLYSDGFDVIISDNDLCSPLNICRISYHSNGTRTGSLRPFLTNIFAARIEPASKSLKFEKGFFVSPGPKFRPTKFVADYVSASGTGFELNIRYRDKIMTSQTITSTANQLFTICGTIERLLQCSQFKIGNSDPKISATLVGWKNIRAAHNLQGGGFILISVQCKEGMNKLWICEAYKIQKIDAKTVLNQQPTQLELKLECSAKRRGKLDNIIIAFSEDGPKICTHFSCASEQLDPEIGRKSSLNFYKSCIPKTML